MVSAAGIATVILASLVALFSPSLFAAGKDQLNVTLRVDLGGDVGQSFGTLWEATNADGRSLAGAGFLNAYNTQDRSDRRVLHVYVRTAGEDKFTLEPLPRPTTDAGTYLFGFDGRLFSKGRGGVDDKLRVWMPEAGRWDADPKTVPFSVQVAGEVMAATGRRITYGGRTVLELAPDQGAIGEWYYAAGKLVVRRYHSETEPPINELIAFDWKPDLREPLDLSRGARWPLSAPREFFYAFGPQDDRIVAASNLGGVHVFDGREWKTVRAPDGKSFQIYATLNTAERLLLGQYPTGELFEFTGSELRRLPGQPPVMKGVSGSAREAQTLAIYGGDIYAGVWPWGEVWRQSGVDQSWRFMGRMFTHPEPTAKTTHPYEEETRQLGDVLNRWGQRVTSLVPLGDSLYLSTSAKGPNPYEPKFTFLADNKHWEYGAVYRYRKPGCLAVPIVWKNGPTTLEFQITSRRIEVWQDDERLGATEWDEEHPALLADLEVRSGAGVFGPFLGRRVELSAAPAPDRGRPLAPSPSKILVAADGSPLESQSEGKDGADSRRLPRAKDLAPDPSDGERASRPFRGAYVHLHRLLDPKTEAAAQEKILVKELDRMKAFGLNAILPFVTTSSGMALYESSLLPEKAYANSDPVKFLAREARARGIGFYPVVPVVVCGNEKPAGILLQHPDWALRHPDGQLMGYLSPAHPEARRWLVRVIREVIAKYQPDGLVLDYIRYANRPLRLDPAGEERFRKSLPADCAPEEEKKLLQQFKEAELTELVRQISEGAREQQPGVTLAAYVWGAHVARNHQIAQVWPRWVERGYLDHINVSGYFHREKYGEKYLKEFERRMAEARELNQGLPRPATLTFALGVITSHGRVQSAEDIRDYLEIADRQKLEGVAYFTWEYLQPYLEDLEAGRK